MSHYYSSSDGTEGTLNLISRVTILEYSYIKRSDVFEITGISAEVHENRPNGLPIVTNTSEVEVYLEKQLSPTLSIVPSLGLINDYYNKSGVLTPRPNIIPAVALKYTKEFGALTSSLKISQKNNLKTNFTRVEVNNSYLVKKSIFKIENRIIQDFGVLKTGVGVYLGLSFGF
jgi:hypothetical protein